VDLNGDGGTRPSLMTAEQLAERLGGVSVKWVWARRVPAGSLTSNSHEGVVNANRPGEAAEKPVTGQHDGTRAARRGHDAHKLEPHRR